MKTYENFQGGNTIISPSDQKDRDRILVVDHTQKETEFIGAKLLFSPHTSPATKGKRGDFVFGKNNFVETHFLCKTQSLFNGKITSILVLNLQGPSLAC